MLLAALLQTTIGWTGQRTLLVDLERHGREALFEDLDVSRTVGWFTSLYPVVLEAGGAGPGDALVSVKERLREVPGRGIGYGLLQAAGLLEEAPEAEVLFNYLGQADATAGALSLFRASTAGTGPCRSPRAHRTHRLEVSGLVDGGRLQVTLTYGSRTHQRETVARLAEAYAGALQKCYVDALKSNGSLKGRVDVVFTVGPAGNVTSVDVDGFDSAVDACIAGHARRWRFDKPDGSATFQFPFTFRHGSS